MMRYWGFVFCFCLWGWGVQGQPEVALKQLLETPGLNHAIGEKSRRWNDGIGSSGRNGLDSGLRDEITAYCICFTGKRERFSF